MDWAWWFMPIIPTLRGAKVGGSLEARSQDQPGNIARPYPYKKIKRKRASLVVHSCIPRTLGGRGGKITEARNSSFTNTQIRLAW